MDMKSLFDIDASSNQISSIKDGTFYRMYDVLYKTKYKTVDLRNNSLTSLRKQAFWPDDMTIEDVLKADTEFTVEMGGNPWSCDLDLCWMIFAQEAGWFKIGNTTATCASPPGRDND